MASIQTLVRHALSVVILFLAGIATAEITAPPIPCPAANNLAGADVVARLTSRNAARAKDLLSFQATRNYQLHYTGFPSPLTAEMQVKVSYTAPGTKQFTIESESGSKLLLNRVLHRLLDSEKESGADDANRAAVAVTTANYAFSLLGCAPGDGRPRYVMQVAPLRDSKYLYRGTVWIDATDFAVTRIEAQPGKNPSFWTKRTAIDHEYQKVDGFYLPALNRTVTDVRMGGKAILTIRYQNYKLTTAAENVADPR